MAQTTGELQEFNAAYARYVNTLKSNPDIAREAARRSYLLGQQLFGENNERTAMLAINYANLLQDNTQAQTYLDEAVTIYQSVFGFGSEAMIDPLMRLGQSLTEADKFQLATVYYRRALQLTHDHLGEQSSKAGAIQLELGFIELTTGNMEQSFNRLDGARTILQQYTDPGAESNLVSANLLLGDYYLKSQQYNQALVPLLAALETLSAFPGVDVTFRNRIALIEAYENLDLRDEATLHCLAIGANRRLRSGDYLVPLYTVIPDNQQLLGASSQQYSVRVSFTVDSEGFVRDPMVMSSVNSEVFSTVFLNAIQQFRFAPRFVDGQAVESPNQQYVFRY